MAQSHLKRDIRFESVFTSAVQGQMRLLSNKDAVQYFLPDEKREGE